MMEKEYVGEETFVTRQKKQIDLLWKESSDQILQLHISRV